MAEVFPRARRDHLAVAPSRRHRNCSADARRVGFTNGRFSGELMGWAFLQTFGSNDDSHRESVLVSTKIIFGFARVGNSPFWIINETKQRSAIRMVFILLDIDEQLFF